MASRIAVKKNTPTNTYNPAEKLNTLSANTALEKIGLQLVWIAQKTASSSGQRHKGTQGLEHLKELYFIYSPK